MLPDTVNARRLLVAAALAGLLASATQQACFAGLSSFTPSVAYGPAEFEGVAVTALAAIGELLLSAVGFVPYLAVVLATVAAPTRDTVAAGVAVLYGAGLLRALLFGRAVGVAFTPATLAVALDSVVPYLGVATAVWVAYGGGYERFTDAVADVPEHPLFAVLADQRVGPDLSLERGVVAAGLGALVATVGLVFNARFHDLLRDASTGVLDPTATFATVSVGLEPDGAPEFLLFEAAFLLGVVFVAGPRVGPRALVKALALVAGVRSTAALVLAVVPSFEATLWGPSGPILGVLGDVTVLVGIGVGVWLAFEGGLERLLADSNPLVADR